VAAVLLPLQVHLSDGHPGEEREVVLQSADGGHRGADAHRVHAHRGPGLHAVWTHLQETQVRALRSPITTGVSMETDNVVTLLGIPFWAT